MRYKRKIFTIELLVEKLNERFGYSLEWPYSPQPGQPAGHTTSMLLQALLAMHQDKHILIFAHTQSYANQLKRQLFLWAWNTGLGQRFDIIATIPNGVGVDRFYTPLTGISTNYLICIDHRCQELPPAPSHKSIFRPILTNRHHP